MITINELFANPNDERVVETLNKLETFAEEHDLEMGDYAGTLDYMNFESDQEKLGAIEVTMRLADEEFINFDECDSVESLFYQEITDASAELATYLESYSRDFALLADTIKSTNVAGQREISERAMYELSRMSDKINDKLADAFTFIDYCLNHKDKE